MKKYLVANWKCNKNLQEISAWLKIVGPSFRRLADKIHVIIAPSFVHLDFLKTEILKHHYQVELSAQDVSPFGFGAYTGSVAAKQLTDFTRYVIVGHSERVSHFGEEPKMVNQKIKRLLENNLTPIICLSDQAIDNDLKTYLSGLEDKLSRLIFMYEPPSAISKQIGPIGSGVAAGVDLVEKKAKQLKKIVPSSLIFYGGSIKADNIKEYLFLPSISGVVIGSASLNASEFAKIMLHATKN